MATLTALSFVQRVQGGFTGKSFTTRCQLYIWISPSMDVVLISPKIQRSPWKVPQTHSKLPGLFAVSLKMTFMWKCFRNIKVNHPLSLLASSSSIKRKLCSSSFFPTKWIRTSLNLLHVIRRNGTQPNISLSVSPMFLTLFQKGKGKIQTILKLSQLVGNSRGSSVSIRSMLWRSENTSLWEVRSLANEMYLTDIFNRNHQSLHKYVTLHVLSSVFSTSLMFIFNKNVQSHFKLFHRLAWM